MTDFHPATEAERPKDVNDAEKTASSVDAFLEQSFHEAGHEIKFRYAASPLSDCA